MREGDLLDQRFRIGRRAGAGGMGVVHVAEDLRTREPIAIKVMHASDAADAARFDREVALLVGLQHPGVVRYVAHGRSPEGEPWLAMEWLAGETLKERSARAQLTAAEVIDVALALASALSGAHAQGIVHRDVKPANVFLSSKAAALAESVKLLDFGIARLRRWQGRTAVQLTEAGVSIGTPAYMSPEQARGEDVGPPSDVFSLGVVLFELASRALPFPSSDVVEALLMLTRERAPALGPRAPGFPSSFAALVDAMLEPLPARRPSMAETFAHLAAIRNELSPNAGHAAVAPVNASATMVGRAAPPPSVVATPAPVAPVVARGGPRSGSRALLAAGGAIALLGGAGVAIALVATRGDENARGPVKRTATVAASPKEVIPHVLSAPPSVVPTPAAPAPSASKIACPAEAFDRCEPLPFADPTAIDPEEFITACVATMQRFDPGARLRTARFEVEPSGRIDIARSMGFAVCTFEKSDGSHGTSDALPDKMVVPHMPSRQSVAGDYPPLTRPACPFPKVWAAVGPRFAGRRPLAVNRFCEDTNAAFECWALEVDRLVVYVESETCRVRQTFDPEKRE